MATKKPIGWFWIFIIVIFVLPNLIPIGAFLVPIVFVLMIVWGVMGNASWKEMIEKGSSYVQNKVEDHLEATIKTQTPGTQEYQQTVDALRQLHEYRTKQDRQRLAKSTQPKQVYQTLASVDEVTKTKVNPYTLDGK